nr:MAG TPA: hypothetical protein [Caudoviricetes sp.]
MVYLLTTHFHFILNHYCTCTLEKSSAIESRQERR